MLACPPVCRFLRLPCQVPGYGHGPPTPAQGWVAHLSGASLWSRATYTSTRMGCTPVRCQLMVTGHLHQYKDGLHACLHTMFML